MRRHYCTRGVILITLELIITCVADAASDDTGTIIVTDAFEIPLAGSCHEVAPFQADKKTGEMPARPTLALPRPLLFPVSWYLLRRVFEERGAQWWVFTASRAQSTRGGRLTPHFLCPQGFGNSLRSQSAVSLGGTREASFKPSSTLVQVRCLCS